MRRDKFKYQILNFRLNVLKIEKICRIFSAHGIEPVLIKGLAAALNYPEPASRAFSDIDLAVAPADYERARKVIEENDFNVDLHRGLRHLDTVEWDDLFRNSRLVEINKSSVRVLRAEDHLRVLCVHWLNDGGVDRTRLWDVYFALQNKPAGFDWERFLGCVSEKRKKWLMTAVVLARDYFGMSSDDLPSDFEKFEIPGWVKKEVETEWASDVRLMPLQQVLNDRKRLFGQVKKRLPPNALQAVVETDSGLSDANPFRIRLNNLIMRIKPSIKRILKTDAEN